MEPSKLLRSSPRTTVRNIEDRLSNLPESLLHHILSFLDMTFVVETSLLSKSWRSLWTTLPYLNFTSKYSHLHYSDWYDSFADIVSSKLLPFAEQVFSRRESSNILSFRLHSDHNFVGIVSLIHAALQCNPIQLHLHLPPVYELSDIWPSIFTLNTLRSMELDLYEYYSYKKFEFPDKIELPLLTSLRLRSFRLLTNNFLEKIFSGCQVLEELAMIGCRFLEDEMVIISSLRLKHLKIDKGCRCKFYGHNYSITISTPNLVSLQYRDYSSRKYFLDSLSSLVATDIDVEDVFKGKKEYADTDDDVESENEDTDIDDDVESENEHADKDVEDVFKEENDVHLVMKYFEGVRNVKNLMFRSPNLRVVFNQTSLEISFMVFKGYIWVVMHILKRCHNIHTLVIKTSMKKENSVLHYFFPEMTEYRGEDLLLRNLKHIEFRNAQGFVFELALLKILLKCATTLERVTIFTCKKVFTGKEIKLKSFSEMLLSYPRASRNAEILLC